MQSTNAAKGGNADYTVALNDKSAFFVNGDNSDDWTDLKANGAESEEYGELGVINNETEGVLVADWVGFGDTVDYNSFTLESAASIAFDFEAGDAAKLDIWTLTGTAGKYSLKSLVNVAGKLDKNTGRYTGSTKAVLLEAGTYYIGVQSTNAAKGGNADYTVVLNDKRQFFTEGSYDDNEWEEAPEISTEIAMDGWVGFGDAIDYRCVTVNENGGVYSFNLTGVEDNVKMTVYSVDAKGKLKSLKSVSATAKKPEISTGTLTLGGAGTYVVAVEATGAKKAQNSHYSVEMEELGVFTGMDNNDWNTATALDGAFNGCLGKGTDADTVDYLDLSNWNGGLVLEMEAGSVKASFYDENKKAVKLAAVTFANNTSKKGVSSLTLKDGDKVNDSIQIAALDESVKYLKIEAAGTGLNSYSIATLA